RLSVAVPTRRSSDLEDRPRTLSLTGEVLATGIVPAKTVGPGQASVIATGAVLPRGADAVVMVEFTDPARLGEDGGSRIEDRALRSEENKSELQTRYH